MIKAISGAENNKIAFDTNVLESNEKAIVASEEVDNIFLSFNGDYTIENVIIDCQLVRVGIWTKGGTITLRNCQLIGDRSSSTGIGIAIAGKVPWKMKFRFGIEYEFSQFGKKIKNLNIKNQFWVCFQAMQSAFLRIHSSKTLQLASHVPLVAPWP